MNYHKALKKAIDRAPAATGWGREQMERRIAEIGDALKGPVGDAMRIMLCEERASLRKGIAALARTDTE